MCKAKGHEFGSHGRIFIGSDPSIDDIEKVVKGYTTSMHVLGMDPEKYKHAARLVLGPAHEIGLYRSIGWHLDTHNVEGCCIHNDL